MARGIGWSAGLVGALLLSAAPAQAKPEKGKLFGDWGVACEASIAKAPETCFVTQTQTVKDKGILLRLSIGALGPKGDLAMVAILPLGISLTGGVAYRVGNDGQQPLVLSQCTMQGCVAGGPLSETTVKAIAAGASFVIGMVPNGSQETLTVQVSTKGFKDAFASLK